MGGPRGNGDEGDVDGWRRLIGDGTGDVPAGEAIVRLPHRRRAADVADHVVLTVRRARGSRFRASVGWVWRWTGQRGAEQLRGGGQREGTGGVGPTAAGSKCGKTG